MAQRPVGALAAARRAVPRATVRSRLRAQPLPFQEWRRRAAAAVFAGFPPR